MDIQFDLQLGGIITVILLGLLMVAMAIKAVIDASNEDKAPESTMLHFPSHTAAMNELERLRTYLKLHHHSWFMKTEFEIVGGASSFIVRAPSTFLDKIVALAQTKDA